MTVVGVATDEHQLQLIDTQTPNTQQPVDMPMQVLLGKPPKVHRDVQAVSLPGAELDLTQIDLGQAIEAVLTQPTVGSKQFLITIGDRTVVGSQPETHGGSMADPRGRCGCDALGLSGLWGPGHCHGRAPTLGDCEPAASAAWPWVSPDQPLGRTGRRLQTDQAMRQLDGRLR